MANGTTQTSRISDDTTALRVEVKNLDTAVQGFRTDLRDVRSVMSTRSDLEAISTQIASIALKQDRAGQPQYNLLIGVVGLCITVLGGIGVMAYVPMTRAVDRNEMALEQLARGTVGTSRFTDYQEALRLIFAEREKQSTQNSIRTLSLEVHDREKIQDIARNGARIDDLNKHLDVVSRRLAEFIRDYSNAATKGGGAAR